MGNGSVPTINHNTIYKILFICYKKNHTDYGFKQYSDILNVTNRVTKNGKPSISEHLLAERKLHFKALFCGINNNARHITSKIYQPDLQ